MESCANHYSSNEAHILRKAERFPKIGDCLRPSAPGEISGRSCAYFGARWVLATLIDAIHIVHGPLDCAYYGSMVRSKSYRVFSTNLEEQEIVFGSVEKLYSVIKEAKHFMPAAKYMLVYMTCAPALLGDDVYGICKKVERALKLPVIMIDCPGFIGKSESTGHRAAFKSLSYLLGKGGKGAGLYDVNIIGQYNINEAKIINVLLKKMGINVHCVFTADAPYEKIITAHKVKLNLLVCKNSGHNFAKIMQERYGIPYLKVSFVGVSKTRESLYKIAEFFNLEDKLKKIILEEGNVIKPQLQRLLPKLKGKKAAIFLGAARVADLINTLQDLGMYVVFAGTRFGNKDNYAEMQQRLKQETYIVDDPSERDLESLIYKSKPDVIIGGIKEQFLCHKFGIGYVLPQMGAYVGFKGFLNFAQNLYKAIYAPVWRFTRGEIT